MYERKGGAKGGGGQLIELISPGMARRQPFSGVVSCKHRSGGGSACRRWVINGLARRRRTRKAGELTSACWVRQRPVPLPELEDSDRARTALTHSPHTQPLLPKATHVEVVHEEDLRGGGRIVLPEKRPCLRRRPAPKERGWGCKMRRFCGQDEAFLQTSSSSQLNQS